MREVPSSLTKVQEGPGGLRLPTGLVLPEASYGEVGDMLQEPQFGISPGPFARRLLEERCQSYCWPRWR